jgi:hypothetical protein
MKRLRKMVKVRLAIRKILINNIKITINMNNKFSIKL